jgi:hypothetical protein
MSETQWKFEENRAGEISIRLLQFRKRREL